MKGKIVQEGLFQKYNVDAEFALSQRKIVSVAFVPCDGLKSTFEVLSQEAPPVFSPQVGHVHHRVVNESSVTNNYSETAHNKFK
ncbi:hypothetical protein HZS_946 [Henneguya salminicola]|nr:hypothetical protein HZS_946 [Henneguya salminicola]